MSEIRPPTTSTLFPPQPGGQAPARATRSDFFKAALDAVQSAPAGPARSVETPQTRTTALEDRPARPGALLDIRV